MKYAKICGYKIPIIGTVGKGGKVTFYKKENNMADKIEINVKVNGVETPLYEVSKQDLLTIRENSKPKPVPAFQVCDCFDNEKRLIFRLPENIGDFANQYVAFNSHGLINNHGIDWNKFMCEVSYRNFRELKLEDL